MAGLRPLAPASTEFQDLLYSLRMHLNAVSATITSARAVPDKQEADYRATHRPVWARRPSPAHRTPIFPLTLFGRRGAIVANRDGGGRLAERVAVSVHGLPRRRRPPQHRASAGRHLRSNWLHCRSRYGLSSPDT